MECKSYLFKNRVNHWLPNIGRSCNALRNRKVSGSIFRNYCNLRGIIIKTKSLAKLHNLSLINEKLRGNKNGKDRPNLRLSHPVLGAGIEPALALGRTGF